MSKTHRNLPELSAQDIQRFWKKVKVTADADECWNFFPVGKRFGRGFFSIKGINFFAARISYFINYGTDPRDLLVCHTCDNPGCVNPKHLFLGTQFDNMQDCSRKGRAPKVTWKVAQGDAHYSRRCPEKVLRGSSNGAAKLTDDDVRNIRKLAADGVKQHEIAKRFNVAQGHISAIVTRSKWAHIE